MVNSKWTKKQMSWYQTLNNYYNSIRINYAISTRIGSQSFGSYLYG